MEMPNDGIQCGFWTKGFTPIGQEWHKQLGILCEQVIRDTRLSLHAKALIIAVGVATEMKPRKVVTLNQMLELLNTSRGTIQWGPGRIEERGLPPILEAQHFGYLKQETATENAVLKAWTVHAIPNPNVWKSK